ncbi:hypothetical protein GCM10020000_43430 [Streptomyces olivoverticillatus]
MQKEVRCGLAPADVLRAEDPRVLEPLVQAGAAVPGPNALVRAGGGDAVRYALGDQELQDLANALDRLEFTSETVEDACLQHLVESVRQPLPGALEDELVNAVDGGAHVVANGLLVGGGVTELGQICGKDRIGDGLAVDEHTVVVEKSRGHSA